MLTFAEKVTVVGKTRCWHFQRKCPCSWENWMVTLTEKSITVVGEIRCWCFQSTCPCSWENWMVTFTEKSINVVMKTNCIKTTTAEISDDLSALNYLSLKFGPLFLVVKLWHSDNVHHTGTWMDVSWRPSADPLCWSPMLSTHSTISQDVDSGMSSLWVSA